MITQFLLWVLKVEQNKCESLRECFQKIGKKGSRFFLENNILKHRLIDDMKCSMTCLILPEICRIPVLKMAHVLGHFKAKKMLQLMKNLFFWPHMRKEIIKYCETCVACQSRRRIIVMDRVPIQSVLRSDTQFDR